MCTHVYASSGFQLEFALYLVRILLHIQVSLPFRLLMFDLMAVISLLRFMNIIMR